VTAIYHIIDRKTSSEQLAQLAMLRGNNEPIYSVAPVADDLPFELAGVIRAATVWDGGQRSGWPGDSEAGSVYHAWSPRATELCHRALMHAPDRRIVATLPTGHEGEPSLWMGHQPGPPTTLVVPTQTTKQRLQEVSRMACEIVVIPPAAQAIVAGAQRAEIRDALHIAADEVLIVAGGTLDRHAGHLDACWAYAICRMADMKAHIAVTGDGEGRWLCEKFARGTGFIDETHFTHGRWSQNDMLAAGDVVALLSPTDRGVQNHAQAMLAGRAVLTAETPEVAEFCGERAILSEPGVVRKAASGMLKLCEDAASTASLATAAQQYAEANYTVAAVRKQYETIYRDLRGGV
jgi:glycosyltransferase involved in cell wall biosynthesis